MTPEIFAIMLNYIGPFMATAAVIGGIVGFAIGMSVTYQINYGDKKS